MTPKTGLSRRNGWKIEVSIFLDGRPLAVVEGGQVFWLHWDHVLRPVLATDATGAVVWAARYLPFGGIDQVAVDTEIRQQGIRVFPVAIDRHRGPRIPIHHANQAGHWGVVQLIFSRGDWLLSALFDNSTPI
jgi:hypothetical protein